MKKALFFLIKLILTVVCLAWALKGVDFRYMRYGEELSKILGRNVDFCSRLNRYIPQRVQQEALPIYE